MAFPPNRKFVVGRGSEMLYNEELSTNFESTRHLLDVPEGKDATPQGVLDGSLWLDRKKNELNSYHKASNTWENIFKDKFQIVDQITYQLPPEHPVLGQLWLYNDVLMYFNGAEWKPVKALEQDGSQFNLSIFENFSLTSPLWKLGSVVVKDDMLAAYEKAERQYIQGKLDKINDADASGDGNKWRLGHKCGKDEATLGDLRLAGKYQMLVPNITVDRIFLNDQLDFHYDKVTKTCIEYDRDFIKKKIPSLVHINPGKLTKMEKRLVKIDRTNPIIKIPARDTEFYGFRKNDIRGRFLFPIPSPGEPGDYEILSNGIYLSYNASQTYDYILAISYEFSWFKATGKMVAVTNQEGTASYYVQDYRGPMNVFVDGYDLEDPYFVEDGLSEVVTIAEDASKSEVAMMNSAKREFGFVREIDLQNRAVIKTLREYRKPLVFMNGEVVHPTLGDIEIDGNYMYVKGGKRDMAWCVIELWDEERQYDMSYDAGVVSKTTSDGIPYIAYDTSKILPADGIVLFIDGLIVKKEDLIRDSAHGMVQVRGCHFKVGQEYVLLQDRYQRYYDESKLVPALPVGHLSDSLVYLNFNLLCNDMAICTTATVEQMSATGILEKNTHGEVKLFLKSDMDRTQGDFKIWDEIQQTWLPLGTQDVADVKSFCYSYENTMRAIKFNVPVGESDDIRVYAFNYANAIEHSLIIRNIPYSFQEYDSCFQRYLSAVKAGDAAEIEAARAELDKAKIARSSFKIKETYIPNIGSLSVWVNGVRQYHVIEWADGTGFDLPEKVAGIVTYVIEHPEKGATKVCEREILTKDNIVPNAINVYRTTKPLYPGRILLYVDGIRQSQDSYTVLDNYRILINDKATKLIGSPDNFPVETILDRDGKIQKVCHTHDTQILVEVKQDYDRQENHVYLDESTAYDIDVKHYGLPIDILEASDEIMIFVDGLFFGLRNLIGYRKDRYRGSIHLMDSEVVARILSDLLDTFLKSSPVEQMEYRNRHDGKDYVPKTKEMLFDWR